MHLYVKSMGKLFRVHAIAETVEDANRCMERDKSLAMIAEDKAGRIYLAEQYGSICPSQLVKD